MPRARKPKTKQNLSLVASDRRISDNALNCDKKRYFEERVAHWKAVLLIDPKIHVQVQYRKVDRESKDDDLISESLKLEEMLISNLERVFIGPERYAKIIEIQTGEGGCWAECDCDEGHYLWFRITYYQDLLDLNGNEFEVMADRCALHECLHIVLWPLASYTENLQNG